jgi:hypothetical protein
VIPKIDVMGGRGRPGNGPRIDLQKNTGHELYLLRRRDNFSSKSLGAIQQLSELREKPK